MGGGVDQYEAGIWSCDLRTNERPGSDHMAWGPMRSLKNDNMKRGHQTDFATTRPTRSRVGEKVGLYVKSKQSCTHWWNPKDTPTCELSKTLKMPQIKLTKNMLSCYLHLKLAVTQHELNISKTCSLDFMRLVTIWELGNRQNMALTAFMGACAQTEEITLFKGVGGMISFYYP